MNEENKNNNPVLRLIVEADLILESALHIGKGEDDPFGASTCYRDGAGELAIPGTSLAGIFFRDLRTGLSCNRKDLCWLQGDSGIKDQDSASPLYFSTLVFDRHCLQLRDRVRIDPKTRTAADGAKFAAFEIARGSRCHFRLELDGLLLRANLRNDKTADPINKIYEAQAIIASVLHYWQDGFGFLGAQSGVGNGRFRLANITWRAIDSLVEYKQWFSRKDKEIKEISPQPEPSCLYCRPYEKVCVTIEVLAGRPPLNGRTKYDHYPLAVGTGEFFKGMSNNDEETDQIFARCFTLNQKGDRIEHLYIPGSSWRGAVLAILRGLDLYEKNKLDNLFGAAKGSEPDACASKVKFGDLFIATPSASINTSNQTNEHVEKARAFSIIATADQLEPAPSTNRQNSNEPTLYLIERHAEDELRGGVYGISKFNEEVLLDGTFKGELFYPTDKKNELLPLMRTINSLGATGFIGMGRHNFPVKLTIAEEPSHD